MKQKAVEMTVCGRRGKPNPGFPPRPQTLEIAGAIPTFPQPQRASGKVEKPNPGFPTFPLVLFVLINPKNQSKKGAWRRVAALPPSGSFFD